jgi:hypothetical protein
MRISTSLVRIALVGLVSAGGVSTASAQPSTGTVFVSGAGFAAIESGPSSDGFGVDAPDTGGTVAGGALGLGIHLTRHVSARVEWALTDRLELSQGNAPLATSRVDPFAGLSTTAFPGVTATVFTSIINPGFRQSTRTSSAYTLLGYHVGEGRLSLEALGGLGLVQQDVKSSYEVRILGLPSPRTTARSTNYFAAAVVGADIRVTLTDHAALVPHVRAYAANGGLSVRPGLALRWTF